MSVAHYIHPKNACIDEILEVMGHARLWPAQAQGTAREIRSGSKHADYLQTQGITERLKHFRQCEILYSRMRNDLHFDRIPSFVLA